MKIIFSIILAIILLSCNQPHETKKLKQTDQAPKKEFTETHSDSIKPKKGKNILVGYYDNYEKLPKLLFDSISEAEFNQLKTTKFLSKPKTKQKGNEFYIETAIRTHTFKKYKDYGEPKNWCGYELLGYYPALKLFALTENSTAEHMGFGELFLLDSTTDYQYTIVSIGDGSVETPIPSPNNKYFVYYDNTMYEHKDSEIRILKINTKTNPEKYLIEYASYSSNYFAVEQIIWKSDQCFYVKGYEEIYDGSEWIKEYKYYSTKFK